MAKQYPRNHFSFSTSRKRRYRRPNDDSSWIVALRYGGIAAVAGLGTAIGLVKYENYQDRNAILASLPAGFEYSGCREVRADGVDPLFRGEPGFSDRLDGDNDGIGCEPYRGR